MLTAFQDASADIHIHAASTNAGAAGSEKTVRTFQLRLEGFLKLYRSFNLNIIPVGCDKKPLIKWEEYLRRRSTEEEHKRWFSNAVNIGLICGSTSNNLLVQDFERYDDYTRFYPNHRALEEKTMVVYTPHGGVHVYFFTLNPVRRSVRLCSEHPLDLLGEGGYVVAPPSIIDGRRYVVARSYEIETLLEAFQPLRDRCGQIGWSVREPAGLQKPPDVKGEAWSRLPSYIASILTPSQPKGFPQGLRHESAIRLASALIIRMRLNPDSALKILKNWNFYNKPPLPDREVEDIVKDMVKKSYTYSAKNLKRFFT